MGHSMRLLFACLVLALSLARPAFAEDAPIAVRAAVDGIEVLRGAPGSESVVGRLALPGPIHDLARTGSVVYVARGRMGVTTVDLTRPEAPREINTFGGGERPVIRLALAGDTLLVIVADFATRAYDVRNPARPADALLLGGPPGSAPILAAGSPATTPAIVAPAPTPTATASSGARDAGEVVAVRKGYLSVKQPGVHVGDRFELRSHRPVTISDPATGRDISAPSNERLGVVEVERVHGDTGTCRQPRGVHASVGDNAVPTADPVRESLMFPRRYTDGMWRVHGVLRPMLSVDVLGFGFIANLSADYHFALPIRIGVEVAPLSFLAQGTTIDGSGIPRGGVGVGAYPRISAAYSTDWFEIGLGVGGELQRFGTSAFVISPRVRLGALDGLHLVFQSDLALLDNSPTSNNNGSRSFIFALGFGEIAIPLTHRVTLVLEGGGADHLAWGILGLDTWLAGNGGPGTLIVHAGVGGAWIADHNDQCNSYYDGNMYQTTCTGTKVSGAGPAASIGFDYRF